MSINVVVVGAGVIGSYLAHELTHRGASVTVLDSAESASGTSAATYGWVNSNEKMPEAYARLNHLGLQAHERAARSPAAKANWFHQTGAIELAQSSQQEQHLEQKAAAMRARDYDATMLSASQVNKLEPRLATASVRAGLLNVREGWIDTTTMCVSLLARAREKGATFIPFRKATEISADGVAATDVDGRLATYPADIIVVAAGNGTRELLARHGIRMPVLDPHQREAQGGGSPTVGLISTTGPISGGPRRVIRAQGVALRPARNGGVTFTDQPTGGRWDHSDPQIWTVPAQLLDRARRLYPSLEQATTETVVLGTRVLPEDGLTIADWVSEDPHTYAIATHSGVTLSAYLAHAVTDEILNGKRHHALDDFGLARFEHPA